MTVLFQRAGVAGVTPASVDSDKGTLSDAVDVARRINPAMFVGFAGLTIKLKEEGECKFDAATVASVTMDTFVSDCFDKILRFEVLPAAG